MKHSNSKKNISHLANDLLHRHKITFIKFIIVGLVNLTIDFSIYSFLVFILYFQPYVANIFSWFVAVTGSYFLNSFFTFYNMSSHNVISYKEIISSSASDANTTVNTTVNTAGISKVKEKDMALISLKDFAKFFATSLFTGILATVFIFLFADNLGSLTSKIIASIIFVFVNYILLYILVFSKRRR